MNKFYRLLSLAVLLSLATTASAYDIEVDGIYYNLNGTTASVTYLHRFDPSNSVAYNGDVNIPSSFIYDGVEYSVTTIEDYAFCYCEITSITIPKSILKIEEYAFGNLRNALVSIVVEDGNVSYDSRDNCNAIIEKGTNRLLLGCQNTVIPTSVESIGDIAFWYCRGLTSIIIPTGVESIGNSVFYECSGLTSVIIPTSVESIGNFAFATVVV